MTDNLSADKPKSYLQSGVNIELADKFVGKIKAMTQVSSDKLLKGAGGYAAVYANSPGERAVAVTTDGVGSKLLLCEEFDTYDTIGIDLVAMCANDLICVGARPALFLDYYACGRLDLARSEALIRGIVGAVKECDMLLVGGETAEMPDLYSANHFDLAGFAVGFVEPGEIMTGAISPGDIVVSVASTGLHSNGYSLARKLIAPGHKLRRELITATALYVRPFNLVHKKLGADLTGAANITGGGWTNLLRLNSKVGFDLKAQPLMPIFEALKEEVELSELYRTFNMGMGFALIVKGEQAAKEAIATFATFDMHAQIAGKVTDQAGQVVIDNTIVLK
ncbi:MAG: phosphoribosylformylglycinamidine cyclo-ligase [Candidatus Obscuribacter sp.]|jgi:phosphoribosylformylglycinamidine cyclo-ligase|nr:phosphoribosylformylglycinamidine cyclo-ligase [Candidatus Obscuribacter sp.]MDQ5967682.1 Phosphoribosylformylglycinamidine cyclo-ligase [Cyanobacteriota bacterium erpe_2018_sw_39hr_WHONDRS-SW48-000098_B_bin.30]MBK7840392.1 phosphoribosylformylglycinamidine cyclo-ligase [Candidatus Obscuribacter sp.]MBK9619886.1 phosphoribosylformylglycinamidine cyclo-ligase [Candidatus Obscuribacter sp.]MBK9770661.1 phosphoribosylformylglycinamidine cyclo-ligase [Candidatus Obscuribacter sp.]